MHKEQYDYLVKNYTKSHISGELRGGYYFVQADKDLAYDICEWTRDMIEDGEIEGDNVNSIGELMEDIFDIFFVS
ncbi:MAG: hypothetical protein LIP08_00335 [Bacteroides sp.]|nr:hypothetical protein [Bacteroides sp.]